MEGQWVLTGAGLITAAGDASRDLYSRLVEGSTLACYEAPALGTGFAGESSNATQFPVVPIRRFDPRNYIKRKGLKDLSRTSQLACTAASRLAPLAAGCPGDRVGVALGSAWGSLRTVVAFERAAHVDGPRFVDPLLFTETVANVPAGQIAIFFGWSAFNGTMSAGAASGLEALRWAIDLLEEDRADMAIAGGCDELNLPLLSALRADGVTAEARDSFPYSEGRSGPIGGEGACVLMVEREDRARSRGSALLGRILGATGRFAGDGHDPEGSVRSRGVELMRELLDRSGLETSQVDLLVLSGNGDVQGDREEALAVIDLFGEGPGAPAVIAPKGILGETWAASGPIGIVAALETMRAGTVPARARGTVLPPELKGLNLPAEPLRRPVRQALVLEASRHGHLSAILVSPGPALAS